MWVNCPKCKGKGWYLQEQTLSIVKIGPSIKVSCDHPGCIDGKIQVYDEIKRVEIQHYKDPR
jgi:hypothetical protein